MSVCNACGNSLSTASTTECLDEANDRAACPLQDERGGDDGPPPGSAPSPSADGATTDGDTGFAVKTAGRSLEPPRPDRRSAPRRRPGLSAIVDLLR